MDDSPRIPGPQAANGLLIPDHSLIRPIGKGAYGEVWLVRNVMGSLRAAKIVYRATFDSDRPYEREFEGIQKFEPLSRSHEGLVDILQIGRNDGQGYFYYVMELADDQGTGRPALPENVETYAPKTLRTETFRQGRLPFEDSLRLGLSLSSALGHLHKNGLIHRDVKPSNVVFVNGIPKLADIGLVASLDASLTFVGTEGFIPPEGPGTVQADIYGLGKVLYEISTGKDRQAYPDPPTELGQFEDQAGFVELNEIILKACASDPEERYRTASEVEEDLVLVQSGRSVKRLRAMERYLRLTIRFGAAAALAALIAVSAYLYQAHQTEFVKKLAQRNLSLADEKQKLADQNLALAKEGKERLIKWSIGRGEALVKEGDPLGALPWFAEALKGEAGNPEGERVPRLLLGNVARQAPRLVRAWQHPPLYMGNGNSPDDPYQIQFAPDRFKVALMSSNRTFEVLDLRSGTLSPAIRLSSSIIWNRAFSPDGLRLGLAGESGHLRIWDVTKGQLLLPPLTNHFAIKFCEFSPDGRRILAAGYQRGEKEGQLRVWDASSGRSITPVMAHRGVVWMARFSPDGRRIVTGASRKGIDDRDAGECRIWDANTGQPIGPLLETPTPVWSVSYSPDGSRFAFGWGDYGRGNEGGFRVCRLEDGGAVTASINTTAIVEGVRFSPDGSRILTRSTALVRIWDAATGRLVTQPQGPHAPNASINGALFNPDGRTFLTFSADGAARIWDATTGQLAKPPLQHPEPILAADFDLEGRYLVTVTEQGAYLWDLVPEGELQPAMHAHSYLNGLKFRPGTNQLLTFGANGPARLWNTETRLPQGFFKLDEGAAFCGNFNRSGSRLVLGDERGAARLWNLPTGQAAAVQPQHSNAVRTATFSLDGTLVLTGSDDKTARLWEALTGKLEFPPLTHSQPVITATFSPDGRKIATLTEKGTFMWDAKTGQSIFGRLTNTFFSAFSPDSLRFVAWKDKLAIVGDANTGKTILELKHSDDVGMCLFSADGRSIATCVARDAVHIWDSSTGHETSAPLPHGGGNVAWITFSPDSRLILTTTYPQGEARLWDVRTGALMDARRYPTLQCRPEFSQDGEKIGVCQNLSGAEIWDAGPARGSPEELTRWAQVSAGRRANPDGNLERTPFKEWHALWDETKGNEKRIEEFRTAAWHDREGWLHAAPATGPWMPTLFHCRAAVKSDPTNSQKWQELGTISVKLLRFPSAAEALQEALKRNREDESLWADLAHTHLAMGDFEAFRKLRDNLIEHDGGAAKMCLKCASTRLCLLFPGSPAPYQRIIDEEVEKSKGQRSPGLSLGMAQYRAGHYEQCLKALEPSSAAPSDRDALRLWPFLAMAHQRLGNFAAATKAMANASEALKIALAVDQRSAQLRRGDLIFGFYIIHEATDLLAGKKFEPPTPQEMTEFWERFSSKLPLEFNFWTVESRAWHREEARKAEKEGDWFGALFHLQAIKETEFVDKSIGSRLEFAQAELAKLPPVSLDTIYVEPARKMEGKTK